MNNLPLPGMAAISLWMLALAVLGAVGVMHHQYPPGVLVLSTALAAAGLGLIRLRRWGWALSLAAVFLSMCFGSYSLFRFRQLQWVVMAVINFVFFLYLVRPEVTGRLRRGA
jgi:uncharacterized membrane protein (DUF2068 family)